MSTDDRPIGDGSSVEVIKSPNDKKLYKYMVLENGLRVLLVSDPEMNATPAAQEDRQAEGNAGMDVEGPGSPHGTCSGIAGGKAGKPAGGKPTVAFVGGVKSGGKAAKAAAADKEESSGDLESDVDDEEEDDDEDEEGEEDEGESGSEGEDEEMASAEGSSSGEGEEEGEEGEEGGRGGRRKKGGGGANKAPVKKAAAAMAVGVGSFSDPEDIQGLSHYLEHMLFMGSARYPAENEYDDFLTRHGGAANAFTDLEATNYHFEVAPPHLAGALDRFAQFFIAPLCNEGSMEREVLAVDSEFCQVLQDDHCRLAQIMCHTARPGHIYRKFSWGNKASLWEQPRLAGIDVRQRLLEYYRQHYGADRSCLVVLGGEDLGTLADMVREAFGGMPAGGPQRGPRPCFAGMEPPFQGRSLHLLPAVRDSHELRLTFQLPPLQRLYGSKSEAYLSHLMGHEGPGSLLSALKARGWATDIMAGVDDDGYSSNSCCSLFGVDVTLTEAGLRAGPGGCGLAVVGLVFAYVNMMRREGPQEWVWQEMKAVAEQRWRFQEEGDPMDSVSRLAGAMHVTSPGHTLVSEYLHASWDPHHVTSLLGRMAPAAAGGEGQAAGEAGPPYRIDLLTRQYDEVKAGVLSLAGREGVAARVEQEPWFGLEVVVAELPESLCQEWARQPHPPELRLPPRNPYLPTDFSLRCDDPDQAAAAAETSSSSAAALPQLPPGVTSVLATPPVLLLDRPGLRLWHKLDTTFRTPRASVHWRLFSPAGHTDPRVAAAGHLTLKLLEEALREDAYLADVAGLHYHTSPEGLAGMEFRVDGFSHKLGVLVGRLAGALAGLAGAVATTTTSGGATTESVSAAPPAAAPQGGQQEGAATSSGGGGGAFPASSDSSPPSPTVTLSASWLAAHFPSAREALVRKYRNMNMEVGQHASYSRLFVLCSRALHCDHILRHLEDLTPQDIPPLVSSLLASCHVEALVHGNVSSGGAVALAEVVVGALGPGCRLGAGERVRDRCVVLPGAGEHAAEAARKTNKQEELQLGAQEGSSGTAGAAGADAASSPSAAGLSPLDVGTVVPQLAKNPKEENAAVEVYYQLGPATDPRDRAVLDLIDQILYEPCYDTLRTKQQLGYSVYSGARLTSGVSGFCIHVVSARHPPEHLDACIESFLAAMGPRIRALTPAELATHVGALVAAKMQRDRNLVDEAGRLWGHISSQRYDFLSRELEVAALETITVEEVYDVYSRYLLPPSAVAAEAETSGAGGGGAGGGAGGGSVSGSQRRKLSVQVRPHGQLAGAKKAAGARAEAEGPGGPAAGAAEAEAVAAAPMAIDGGADAAAAVTGEAAAAALEPDDLVALRSRFQLHGMHLGTPPQPLLQ